LRIADDGSPGAGGDRDVLPPGQRQGVEDNVRHLLDRASGPTHGRNAFELDGGGNRREQNRKNVVASGINVENDAFHSSPSTRPDRPPRSWIEMLRLAPSSRRSPGSGAVEPDTIGRRGRPRRR